MEAESPDVLVVHTINPRGSLKRVITTANAPEAHVAAAVLENAGIEAVIRGEHMGALPAGIASRPSVWVRDEDYDAACELLGIVPELAPANQEKSPARLLIVAIIVLALLLLLRD